MKIAVVDNLPEGGAKRVVFEQIKQLANNHQIYYFTNQTESIFPFSKYTESVKIFDLGISSKKMIFRLYLFIVL